MEAINFSIHIQAPREKVWDIMLGKDTYGEWAKAFGPGSSFEGDWNEGSAIHFLAVGSEMGMVSRIKESRKPEFVSIEHIGLLMSGEVDTTSDEAKKWASALESYTFKEIDGGTEVSVSLDVIPEYKTMFEEMWPEALTLLKALAEK